MFDPAPSYQMSFPTMQCAVLHDTLHSAVKTLNFIAAEQATDNNQ